METERIRVKKYIILQRTYVFWQPTSLVQISPSSISRESVRKKTLNDDNLPSLRRLCIFLRRHCVDAARLPGCPAAWLLCAVWFTSVIAWWDSRVYVYTGMSVCVCTYVLWVYARIRWPNADAFFMRCTQTSVASLLRVWQLYNIVRPIMPPPHTHTRTHVCVWVLMYQYWRLYALSRIHTPTHTSSMDAWW